MIGLAGDLSLDMRFLRPFFKPEVLAPMLAMTFASGVCAVLIAARILWTRDVDYASLLWNLFLAWLPLIFAVLASDRCANGWQRDWGFIGFAIAWLLFFPNAPYIFTDLIHVTARFAEHVWVDMMLILICAMTGFILGFVSLYLMQSVVAQFFGKLASWIFVMGSALLGSFGIYLGRFMRFNSWDVVVKPGRLYREIGAWSANATSSPRSVAFLLLFAAFFFVAYLMLYALTHLSRAPRKSIPQGEGFEA